MNAINSYLYEKVQLPEKEWLRREPRTTHPLIREAVRAARDSGGLFYDDDVNGYVADLFGVTADRLLDQLGHECYIGKGELKDEQALAELREAEAEGYERRQLSKLPDGRYLLRAEVTYVGQNVPTLVGEPQEVRIKNGTLFQKYARTGYGVTGWALCRAI